MCVERLASSDYYKSTAHANNYSDRRNNLLLQVLPRCPMTTMQYVALALRWSFVRANCQAYICECWVSILIVLLVWLPSLAKPYYKYTLCSVQVHEQCMDKHKAWINCGQRLPQKFEVAWLGVWQINHTLSTPT